MHRYRWGGALAVAVLFMVTGAHAADDAAIKRGEYVFNAGGCESCHTDRKNNVPKLAGGPAIKTPFGTFYGPNITPHRERGIGAWSETQFARALRDGVSPSGAHYFPSFPYTSFTNITDGDVKDMWAYMATVPSSDRPSKPHEISFPFSWRFAQVFWRQLGFASGPFKPDSSKPEPWNRGAYLVTALTHCGECHTPRDRLGALDRDNWLAGNPAGPDGARVPNITPDRETGIGAWSEADIATYLSLGMNPSGDTADGLMGEVVEFSTGKLTEDDLKAIAVYLKSLKPIRNAVRGR